MEPLTLAMTTTKPRRPARQIRLLAVGLVLSIALAFIAFRHLNRFDPWGTAHSAFDRREIGTALSLANAYLESHPGDPRASILAARCETRLGRLDIAESHYRAAGPREQGDLQARALGLIKLNQPEKAALVYQDLLKHWPDDAVSLQRLGSIRIGQKAWGEVRAIAESLIKIPDAEIAGQTMLAISLHESRQYKTAIEAFERVVALDPELKTMPLPKALFWRNYATDLLAEGRTADARTLLERAISEQADVSLVELLGQSFLLDNEPEKAENCWQKAIELDDAFVDTWLDLGQLAIRRRQWPEAIKFLKRATQLDPNLVESHHALGIALRNQGNIAEAEKETALAATLRAKKNTTSGQER